MAENVQQQQNWMSAIGGVPGLLSGGAFGMGLLTQLFAEDPMTANRRIAGENRRMIEDRLSQMFGIMDQRGEFFDERMADLSPFLAFSDTQGRQAATAGAKAAQASVRRSLGSGGDLFSSILAAGAGTAATDRQNTLRAMAIQEAGRAADNEVAMRVNIYQNSPFQFNPGYDGSRSAMMASLWGNLGTGFGGIASQNQWRQQMDQWMKQNQQQTQPQQPTLAQ